MPTKLFQQVECIERLPAHSTEVLTNKGRLKFVKGTQMFHSFETGFAVQPTYWLEECKPDDEVPASSAIAQPTASEQPFRAFAETVLQYMSDKHPHVVLIATPTSVQLLEGFASTGEVYTYIKD